MNTPNQPVSQGTNYSNTDHAAFDEITNPNTGCDDTRLSPSLDDTPDLDVRLERVSHSDVRLATWRWAS